MIGSNRNIPLCISGNLYPQIPGDDADDLQSNVSPEQELTRRFKDVMRRIFWDRFTQSLLPSPTSKTDAAGNNGNRSNNDGQGESGVSTPREGSKVHVRYGSDKGSYYAATILAVTPTTPGSASTSLESNQRSGGSASPTTVARDDSTSATITHHTASSTQSAGTVLRADPADARPRAPGDALNTAPGDSGDSRSKGKMNAEGGGGVRNSEGSTPEGVVVDVRYDGDNVVERGVPISRLKKSGEAPDFGPLLSLLGEVR